jgi:hypothetical protein
VSRFPAGRHLRAFRLDDRSADAKLADDAQQLAAISKILEVYPQI